MLLLPLLLSLLFVASAITAVPACISDTCVSCPSPLFWLKSLLLTMKLMMVVLVLLLTLMVMTVVAVAMVTSRAHSCAQTAALRAAATPRHPHGAPRISKATARDVQGDT